MENQKGKPQESNRGSLDAGITLSSKKEGLVRIIVQTCSLALVGMLALLPRNIAAQEIKPALVMTVPAAEVRATPNFEPFTASTEPGVEVPFRPEDPDEYARSKEEADRQEPMPRGPAIIEQIPFAPPTPDIGFEGLNQTESGGLFPPDTHGAVGRTQFVQVVNTQIAVFDKETGERLKSVSLNTLFGYPTPPVGRFVFDPRVVYDRIHDRWVVTAPAFAESPTVQFFFIGVSQTEDATGPFFIYPINVTVLPFEFFDFPQLGMDQNAVIITANIFGPRSGTDLLPIAKADLYEGLSLRIPRFMNLFFNTVPPIVLDDNPKTFLVATRPGTPNVILQALVNSGQPDDAALRPQTFVNVGLYTIPPSARQPETTARLDTLDARFQNASTQIGDSLFNVHTINLGLPTPRWYEIDTAADSVIQSGLFFATLTSDDFNPSITVNDDKDVFVTWSSSQAPSREDAFFFPQVRASGRLNTDPPGEIPSGSVIFQSPTFLTQFRWGDYSAVTVDPLNPTCAWGVNEKVNASFVWGSFIFRTCFP